MIRQDDRTHWDDPPGPVVYYVAWSPDAGRAELLIGPNQLDNFLSHEEAAKRLRNLAYFGQRGADDAGESGQPSASEVYLAKSLMAFVNDGDTAKALTLWGKAWVEQAKNPMTWMNVLIGYAGTLREPGLGGPSSPGDFEVPEGGGGPAADISERPAVEGAAPHAGVVEIEPQAKLPSGTSVPPDSYSGGYYGTSNPAEAPEVVGKEGFPARGSDWRLREHSEENPDTAFRGTTNIASDGAGRGAAYWAGEGGYVYEVRGVPTWDVNKNLQGRVPLEGFRGNLMHGEGEYAIPARVTPDKIVRWGVVKDKGGDVLYVEWH
jgi:hypothetical protein